MRWGLLPPKKLREFAWKKLYIQVCSDTESIFLLYMNSSGAASLYWLVGGYLLFVLDLDDKALL